MKKILVLTLFGLTLFSSPLIGAELTADEIVAKANQASYYAGTDGKADVTDQTNRAYDWFEANADRDAKIEEENARRAKEQQRFNVDTEVAETEKALSPSGADAAPS